MGASIVGRTVFQGLEKSGGLEDKPLWKELLEQDKRVFEIIFFSILGTAGGAVRLCGHPNKMGLKVIISSLMASAFAGYLTAVFFPFFYHYMTGNEFSDQSVLGAICAIGGYSGQLTLVLISKIYERKLRSIMPDNNGGNGI